MFILRTTTKATTLVRVQIFNGAILHSDLWFALLLFLFFVYLYLYLCGSYFASGYLLLGLPSSPTQKRLLFILAHFNLCQTVSLLLYICINTHNLSFLLTFFVFVYLLWNHHLCGFVQGHIPMFVCIALPWVSTDVISWQTFYKICNKSSWKRTFLNIYVFEGPLY